jgi:hypothetical protein
MACSGGNGGATAPDAAAVAGFEVPEKISAIPTNEDAAGTTGASASLGFAASLRAFASALTDPDSDYNQAQTITYVEEHALEQFNIIEQVLGALSQTHYADEENIGAGPYKCMVAWEDEQDGRNIKQLQPWIVESEAILENGQNVLRARAWIEEIDEDEIELIKAEFKVYEPATKYDDGSYADFGVWTMMVKFDEDGENDFFAASAEVGVDGEAIIKIHEKMLEDFDGMDEEFPAEIKAIMHRSDTHGYGKVYYPDFESLFGPGTDFESLTEIPHVEAKYAYNQGYLAVNGDDPETDFKDRNSVTEMTHRYGVFDAVTGDDVLKTKSFGFPIRYTKNDLTQHAYYGAWQGRHQIWTMQGADGIAEGTEVVRADMPPDEAETYIVGPTFDGTLTKRTLIPADIDDIQDIPVEIWIDNSYNLNFNAGKWWHCPQWDWDLNTCQVAPVDFDVEIGLSSLVVEEENMRKHVSINGWHADDGSVSFVYELASDANGNVADFYRATWQGHRLVVDEPRTRIDPTRVPQLWIHIGGSIYVEWDGDSWVEKELINFDTRTWTPEFGDNDMPFTLPDGKEFYINMQGANYVVRRDGATYTIKLELQTAANPANATTIADPAAVFKDQWNPDGNSTYEFITDPESENYLMLVYETIGDNDKDGDGLPMDGVAIGAVVRADLWGLQAYVDDDAVDAYYNWEYDSGENDWGSMVFLLDEDENFVLLDDPLRFESISVTNNGGEEKTLALQYDGWMMGLPMMYDELAKNDWNMTDEIADKIINMPALTELTDAVSGDTYVVKPLEISQFLNEVDEEDIAGADVPDISLADDVDLDTVPDFVEHGMGAMPSVSIVKYSEGKLVE